MSPAAVQREVIVLGAGQAGLAAAYRVAQRGIPVTILEGRDTIGGIGGSFEIDGITVDYGSHRFNTACNEEVLADLRQLLGDDLLSCTRNSRIRLRGRWIRMPFHALELLRLPGGFAWDFSADLAAAAIRGVLGSHRHGETTFPELLMNDLGSTLCQDFYYPYARKVWGTSLTELSVPPAHRQRSGNFFRNVACHTAATLLRRKTPGADQFLYPRRGFGQMTQAYCDAACEAGARLLVGARVTAVKVEDDRVKAVRYEQNGKSHTMPAECVWSTLPITLLARCIEPRAPENILAAASGLSYRGMLLIYLVVEQDRFTEYDTHFIPDEDIPITRLSEPKVYNGVMEPRGRTVLCLEMPSDPTSQEWAMSDDELGQLASHCLNKVGLPIEAPIHKTVTRRLRIAYPIYRTGTDVYLEEIDQWLSQFKGLLTFGLQGLFGHDDSHHVLYMAYAAEKCLRDDGVFDWERWYSFRKVFEAQVAEFLKTMNGISI